MSLVYRHNFGKRKRMHTNLSSPTSEFCYYVCRQKFRITSRLINISILYFKITIKNILKVFNTLNLIQQYVIHIIIFHF